MTDGCSYCGGIVCVHIRVTWYPGYGTYDALRWREEPYPDRHCQRAWCRMLDAYWFKGVVGREARSPPHSMQWRGPLIYLYELAEFLGRMAEPKSQRDLEYSKRFAHRQGIAA